MSAGSTGAAPPAAGEAARTLLARLVRKTALAHDVAGLELALPPHERLRFRAGQYVDLLLRDGRRRAFSLAGPPSRGDRLELHVRRIPGGRFSGYVLDELRERTLMRFSGPLGNFWLRRELGRPVILIAGGTGFAPVKSILEDAIETGFEQPVHLYRGARARRDLYLDDATRELAARLGACRYVPVLSEPDPAQPWSGRTGLVHEAVLADHPDLAPFAIYLSGPPAMVDAARDSFPAHGAQPAALFCDSFDHAWQTGHDRVG